MAEKVYLNWTLENWVTVVLMVFIFMFAVGLISSAIRTFRGTAAVPGASPDAGMPGAEGY